MPARDARWSLYQPKPARTCTFAESNQIVELTGSQKWEEGCLSFPGATEEIRRAERVRVRALDQHGQPFTLEADGLLAVAIQHENDHLNGVLMIDKLNALRRRLVSRKVGRYLQEEATEA